MIKVIQDQRQSPSDVKDDTMEQYLAALPQKTTGEAFDIIKIIDTDDY